MLEQYDITYCHTVIMISYVAHFQQVVHGRCYEYLNAMSIDVLGGGVRNPLLIHAFHTATSVEIPVCCFILLLLLLLLQTTNLSCCKQSFKDRLQNYKVNKQTGPR